MSNTNSEISFKFRYVKNNNVQSLFAQKGIANEQEILLGKERLIYDDIADSTTRDNRLILAISPTASLSQKVSKNLVNESALVLEVHNAKALNLERFIDRISSKKEVELKRQQLRESGQEHLFYSTICPECSATIDLSSLSRSSYIYCRFCETVFREKQSAITKGEKYRICDECQMFDRIRAYTEFYFYFLLIVYGFSYKRRYLCDNCANTVFWKTLLLNLIFLLGIPSSIWIKIKSMIGRDQQLKELAKANALSKKGNYQQAVAIYNRLYQGYPEHPGLLMDQGLGHLFGNDSSGALTYFQRSLKSCSNYYPTQQLIQKLSAASQESTEE